MTEQLENSEAAALASLVEWSADCPPWQRDALKRLSANGALTLADIDVLLAIAKGEQEPEFFGADDVRDPTAGRSVVTLRQLKDVEHVNALAANERLTFGRSGLTIIYGDNGSGKSGYARILKKMCRARVSARGERILPNIYTQNLAPPQATIDFTVNDQNRSATWIDGQATNPLLSAVSVFDARTANIHVDQTNDVAYTPLPLKILATLAQTCQTLKDRLGAEITAIQRQTPGTITNPRARAETAVGKLIGRLSAATSPQEVEALATLSPAELDRG